MTVSQLVRVSTYCGVSIAIGRFFLGFMVHLSCLHHFLENGPHPDNIRRRVWHHGRLISSSGLRAPWDTKTIFAASSPTATLPPDAQHFRRTKPMHLLAGIPVGRLVTFRHQRALSKHFRWKPASWL